MGVIFPSSSLVATIYSDVSGNTGGVVLLQSKQEHGFSCAGHRLDSLYPLQLLWPLLQFGAICGHIAWSKSTLTRQWCALCR